MSKKLIIIGAGFSGLAAAAFMARAGWEVRVIEKNKTAGGRARQLNEQGFSFDMGPSWYWMPDVFERFFNQFGKKAADYYSLTRLNPSYRIYWDDGPMDLPADEKGLRELFEALEPGSAARLDKYLEEAKIKYDMGMGKLVYKPGLSLTEYLNWNVISNMMRLHTFGSIKKHIDSFFRHPKLRQIMEFPVLFLGALPENTPALYSLMNYADMVGGTWYPKGGMYSVVKAMQQLAEEQGVVFQFEEEVKNIHTRNGVATKITTTKNDYEANAVISAADYAFTESNLLVEEARSYSEAYWNKKILAPSCLLYYIGLNKKLKQVLHHSLFFDVPFDLHARQIYTNPQWPDEPLFYLSVSSKTDPGAAPEGGENLVLLVPVASGLTNDTEELRATYFDKLMSRIERHLGESIRDAIVYQKSYSVSDFSSDYHSFKGNAYGLANTLNQTAIFRPSCQSKKIKNLFYAGQLTVPGPGVPPSIISGEVVSNQLLKTFKSSV